MLRAALTLLLLGACAAQGDAAGQNAAQAKLEAEADRLEERANAADEPEMPVADVPAIRIACDLGPRFLKDFDESRRSLKAAEHRALYERIDAMRWRTLPPKADCGDGRTITFQPEGFGAFVTAIAMTADGREVAIRGGWQSAPLAGSGGECLFARVGTAWRRKGCIQTWVS